MQWTRTPAIMSRQHMNSASSNNDASPLLPNRVGLLILLQSGLFSFSKTLLLSVVLGQLSKAILLSCPPSPLHLHRQPMVVAVPPEMGMCLHRAY